MEFTEYVAARRTGLVRATVLLGCPQPDAEYVVELALLRARRSWRQVDQAAEPEADVYAILVRTLGEVCKRRWNGELPPQNLPEEPEGRDRLVALDVRRALANLTPEQRQILVLRFYADLSERETATALRMRPGGMQRRTAEALAALAADPNLSGERHDAR